MKMKSEHEFSNKDRRMLANAETLAKMSTCRHRHGAIVVKGGRTLAVGINRMKNDPEFFPEDNNRISVHAEVAAVKACGTTDLKGAILYVARAGRNGRQMMSKPCANCQKFLTERGIKKVIYTVESSMDL